MTTSRTLQLVLAGILAAATVACGPGADAEPATADDSAATTADAGAGSTTVTIDDLAYAPADVDVPVGATVEWRNDEDVPHTVTFSTDAVEDSGELGEGDTFSSTFTQTGTFDYVCAIHPDMAGSVTVQ